MALGSSNPANRDNIKIRTREVQTLDTGVQNEMDNTTTLPGQHQQIKYAPVQQFNQTHTPICWFGAFIYVQKYTQWIVFFNQET